MSEHPVRLIPRPEGRGIDVVVRDQPFTAYIWPEFLMKPVLYPVMSPENHRLTRGFPIDKLANERTDHPHHVGIWFNYGDVNGLDFWNHSAATPLDRKPGFGTIRHRAVEAMTESDDGARLVVASDWLRPDGSILLEEQTVFRFACGDGVRLLDREATLTALDEDVLFKDNKEGMIAVRVARGLEQPGDQPERFTDAAGNPTDVPCMEHAGVGGRYYSSEGLEGDAVWGTRARWVNLAGRVEGEEVAIILIDHPGNPGYPTYWHARGYGLFAANPLGQAALSNGRETLNFRLRKGDRVTFRYRFVIHSGPRPAPAVIDRRYAAWE